MHLSAFEVVVAVVAAVVVVAVEVRVSPILRKTALNVKGNREDVSIRVLPRVSGWKEKVGQPAVVVLPVD